MLSEPYQGENFVRKNDNFVTSLLMKIDQVFCCYKLVWVTNVQGLFLTFLGAPVFRKKVRSHFAPDFYALDLRQIALVLQILPVCFVEFGPNQKIKISNLFILSDQGGRET
jgi:hypothetical protein